MFHPLSISVVAYGLVWGELRAARARPRRGRAHGPLVFAGASQFVALEMWSLDFAAVGAIVFATLIVNLRLKLMTATLRPSSARCPPAGGTLATHFVTDETWAMTMAEMRGAGPRCLSHGGRSLCFLSWLIATLTGATCICSAVDDPNR